MSITPKQFAAIVDDLGEIDTNHAELESQFYHYLNTASREHLAEGSRLVTIRNVMNDFCLNEIQQKLNAPIAQPPKFTAPKRAKIPPKPKKQKKLKHKKRHFHGGNGNMSQAEFDRLRAYEKNQQKAKAFGTGRAKTNWPSKGAFSEGLIRVELGGKVESNRRKF